MPTQDDRIAQILKWLRDDMVAIRDEPDIKSNEWEKHFPSWYRYTLWLERRDDAEQGIVPLDLARWLGRPPSRGEAEMYGRAWRAGAGRYWVLLKSSGRTVALELKPEYRP